MGRIIIAGFLGLMLALGAAAADYAIDPTHSFVEWRTQHLGYSWLYGRFNNVDGRFTWDADNPAASAIEVTIDTTSLDSNHAERDKHLRGEDFLDVKKYPQATFKSTGYRGDADGGVLEGVLTLHGVSKPVEFDVKKLGEGGDPWGGYRAGFFATTQIDRRDFGIDRNLGPASNIIELELGIEGVREKSGQPKR